MLSGFVRPDGRVGSRHHLLVVPSVVCATLVADQIAHRTGGISFVHQNGCGHIGDDVDHTESAFLGVSINPNVAATLVVSLGCETIQGRKIADRLAAIGDSPVGFVGIQKSGGTQEAIADGTATLEELAGRVPEPVRTEVTTSEVVLGLDARSNDPRAMDLADHALDSGMSVVLSTDNLPSLHPWSAAEVVGLGDRPSEALSRLGDPGHGAQHHAGLAAAGAQVIVSFLEPERYPMGFVVVPVITVATGGRLHEAVRSDFDHGPDADTETVWSSVVQTFSGALTVAEQLGSHEFLVPRLRRTM